MILPSDLLANLQVDSEGEYILLQVVWSVGEVATGQQVIYSSASGVISLLHRDNHCKLPLLFRTKRERRRQDSASVDDELMVVST